MTDETTPPDDLRALYRRAFEDYWSVALWNMRPLADPTPADALAITSSLRTHGGMDGRRLSEHIERLCRATYIATGVALNREGPRFSGDIDIFQDSEDRLLSAAEADAVSLERAGLKATLLEVWAR